jgi:NMD protein affecting ribosome stability and mRNA decay
MRRERSKTHQAASQPRSDRAKLQHEETFFRPGQKLREPTACLRCDAVYRDGRWTWSEVPADAHGAICPACERIQKNYPAGLVTIRGAFARAHRDEILALAHNLEEREKDEHPLKRILKIEEREDELLISTTDSHLAHGLGAALQHAYHGEVDYGTAAEPGDLVRVSWER